MIKIIPAINVPEWEEIVRRIKLIESFAEEVGVDTAHLDVTDGTFTKNSYWHRASDLLSLETSLKIEVHLMIGTSDNPIEERIAEWLLPQKIMRAILHVETSNDVSFAIEQCRKAGIQVGLAVAPGTPWTQLVPHVAHIEMAQVLGVHPGLSRQEMQKEEVLDKIRHLSAHPPGGGLIEVDGGVSPANARDLIGAGANVLVAGSAIFDADDPKEAIHNLRDNLRDSIS